MSKLSSLEEEKSKSKCCFAQGQQVPVAWPFPIQDIAVPEKNT